MDLSLTTSPIMGARIFWLLMLAAGVGSVMLFIKSMSGGDDED